MENATYREMYYTLAAAVADAVELLECFRPQEAKNRLILAQQKTEEMYLQSEEAEIE